MRTGRVIAAGLCFLAVATPNISTAQSPKAKAANAVVGVVKQTSRLKELSPNLGDVRGQAAAV